MTLRRPEPVRLLLRGAELAAMLEAADAADALAEGYRARPPLGWEALRDLRSKLDRAESRARYLGGMVAACEDEMPALDAAGVELADAAARLDLRP